MSVEKKLKRILGIPEEYRLYSLTSYEVKGLRYYKVLCYAPAPVKKIVSFSVPRAKEKKILSLWGEYEKVKEKRKRLKKLIDVLGEKELEKLSS